MMPAQILGRVTLVTLVALVLAPPLSPPFYRDKTNLLVYLDSEGKEHPVKTPAEWEQRREHILLGMQLVMGPVPEHWRNLPLEPQVREEVETPRYVRKKVSFRAEPEDRVTAYLLVPKERKEQREQREQIDSNAPEGPREPKGKFPAVLCLHQTTDIGKDEPAGFGSNPDLRYAVELAERGYVTLAPDYWTFGEYRGKKYDPYDHGYVSGTMKGIWNHIRSVDYLSSLREVDAGRIGCIGHSLGGHNTLWLGAFEPRVKAMVSSCGFCTLAAYAASRYGGGDLKNYAQRRYLPRVAEVYGNDPKKMPWEFTEVLGALAPRPVFVNAPLKDENFVVEGVRECIRAALPVYQLYGAKDSLKAVYPDAGHAFSPEVRRQAYEFLDRALGRTGGGGEEAAAGKGEAETTGDAKE